MFVKREIPKSALRRVLKLPNGQFGMVNLSWPLDSELLTKINAIDGAAENFLNGAFVNIYFPAFQFFYRKAFFLKSGHITLGELLALICNAGYDAMGKTWLEQPNI